MGLYEQWSDLTVAEKAFLAMNPHLAPTIYRSKDIAYNETTARFGYNGRNDNSDAFRHCFWSAYLAREMGYLRAWQYTSAHEYGSPHPSESRMDLHNNSIGLTIGGGDLRNILPDWTGFPDSNSQLSNACYSALNAGKLQTAP
ncbi:hypothetical protein RM543_14795 [Roseicyclus sp. F158]|uniref:DUF6973 domain-containing protein n=1 Tax=Tropicimonas omnivorans TaxID=3075590 RepID=A0ABU3DJR3_9RHOB|nr:hypothetical protein [Roseicyclus sp. F158]MDT0683956.1 hypothetical protein [Roseicyclus sp. F158]